MKKFIPFLLVSIALFVTMKGINHINKQNSIFVKPDSLRSCSIGILKLPKEIIFRTEKESVTIPIFSSAALPRLLPSDFKAYCFYNCKLLPVSKGLCFFPGGLPTSVESKPLYDQYWKRQFIQYL